MLFVYSLHQKQISRSVFSPNELSWGPKSVVTVVQESTSKKAILKIHYWSCKSKCSSAKRTRRLLFPVETKLKLLAHFSYTESKRTPLWKQYPPCNKECAWRKWWLCNCNSCAYINTHAHCSLLSQASGVQQLSHTNPSPQATVSVS